METEKAMELTLKLTQHNKNIRRILGSGYPVKIIPFMNLLEAVMKQKDVSIVKAIQILKEEGISPDFLLAAAYEVLNKR